MKEEKCIMFIREGACEGYNDIKDICGPLCPYRKTRTQQLEIEEKLMERFRKREGVPLRNYKSRLTGLTLYPAYGDFNKKSRRHA